ncbi:hypothetical protein [Kitasatospora sp. NPDC088783]|uniref:hypothetical protein n=1 Tax=Kitasatospora sp. NPDC088783 TaxID=3364077 RepID=UPI00380A464C
MTSMTVDPRAARSRMRRHLWVLACAPVGVAAVALAVGCLFLLPLVDRSSRTLWAVGALTGFCYVVLRVRKWVGRLAAGTVLDLEEVLCTGAAGSAARRTPSRAVASRVGPFPRFPRRVRRAVEAALVLDADAGAVIPGPATEALLTAAVDACGRWADALDRADVRAARAADSRP